MSAGGFGGGGPISQGGGAGDSKGSEALKGETTEQYVARQRRLQAEARERMRNKFGGGSMGGCGSNSDYDPATGGYGGAGGLSVAGVGDKLKTWGAAVNNSESAAELKAKTAETAKAGWGVLKSWGSTLSGRRRSYISPETGSSSMAATAHS